MSKTLGQRLEDLNIEVGTAMTIDWEQVRIQVAIEFAAQILGNHGGAPTSVAKDAVDYADALVEELKRSDDVYAECRRLDAINTASVCENMTKIQKELQKKDDNTNIQQ